LAEDPEQNASSNQGCTVRRGLNAFAPDLELTLASVGLVASTRTADPSMRRRAFGRQAVGTYDKARFLRVRNLARRRTGAELRATGAIAKWFESLILESQLSIFMRSLEGFGALSSQ